MLKAWDPSAFAHGGTAEAPRPPEAGPKHPAGGRHASPTRASDETCPVSTEGGTRRVQLVREGGGGTPADGAPAAAPAGPPREAPEPSGSAARPTAGRAPSIVAVGLEQITE